jgi:hypothetical protein
MPPLSISRGLVSGIICHSITFSFQCRIEAKPEIKKSCISQLKISTHDSLVRFHLGTYSSKYTIHTVASVRRGLSPRKNGARVENPPRPTRKNNGGPWQILLASGSAGVIVQQRRSARIDPFLKKSCWWEGNKHNTLLLYQQQSSPFINYHPQQIADRIQSRRTREIVSE